VVNERAHWPGEPFPLAVDRLCCPNPANPLADPSKEAFMRLTRFALVFAAGVAAGCMTAGPPAPAQAPAPAATAQGSPMPLILDRSDLSLGTTVQFARIPSANELYDLHNFSGLAHVVITLPDWPKSYPELDPLQQTPSDADLIVVIRGFPPTREATEAWNQLQVRARVVLLAQGPPPSTNVLLDLNSMRALERVIVETDDPSHRGYERLQRPISFRVVRD
jgi:hypothetical protein